MYVNSNGYATANSGTNGYVTATSEQLVVKVYTVQTDLVRLPIAESGHVYVLGKKLFDHPLKEGRVKNAPHLLLM